MNNSLRKYVLGPNKKTITPGLSRTPQDYAPVKWTHYFEEEQKVTIEAGKFHVYKRGNKGPAIVCLHGGGYSGLTWALFATEIAEAIECQVVAIDLRGHGNTMTKDDADLSLSTMASDVAEVVKKLFRGECPVVLVGHSMGGAVAVEASYLIKTTVGLCVIDVVEGTALDALSSMQSILKGRPNTFKSIQHAIQWCHKGGQTHNIEAAKVSMPGQIINKETGNLAANECDTVTLLGAEEFAATHFKKPAGINTVDELDEEDEDADEQSASSYSSCEKPPLPKTAKKEPPLPENDGPKYTWRINLSKTEHFWSGWFKGLSQKFIDNHIPKLLLLANINGLDTALTVAQMQGKFQLQVLQKSGHAIHEDQPHQVTEIIGSYLVKQKVATPKGDLGSHMPGC